MSLLHGNIRDALYINPLGLLLSVIICVYFMSGVGDRLFRTNYTVVLFHQPFKYLKNHKCLFYLVIGLCGVIAILNAYWNYCKGL